MSLVSRSRGLVPCFVRSLSTRVKSNKATLSDPFPLPLEPNLATSPASNERLPPLPRTNETPETLRARLIYQSRKRGTLEADLLLSTFAAEHLHTMNLHELREFDKLMDEPDWDIYYWAIGKRSPPEQWSGSALLKKLSKHAANEGKVTRRMPDLSTAQA